MIAWNATGAMPLMSLKCSAKPAVIRTEEENERLMAELERFDRRSEELTPEEREYSELLTVLIEALSGTT